MRRLIPSLAIRCLRASKCHVSYGTGGCFEGDEDSRICPKPHAALMTRGETNKSWADPAEDVGREFEAVWSMFPCLQVPFMLTLHSSEETTAYGRVNVHECQDGVCIHSIKSVLSFHFGLVSSCYLATGWYPPLLALHLPSAFQLTRCSDHPPPT